MKKIVMFLLCLSTTVWGVDMTFSAPATLSSSGVNATNSQVVMDINGNAVAVWLENGFVISQSQPYQGTWSSSTTLSLSGASTPEVVIDGSGNATAIWNESGVIKSASQPFGSTWSAATILSGAGAIAPALSADAAGNVVAVWVASGNAVNSKTKPAGGSWQTNPDILASSNSATPQVAIGNGTVVAVWYTPVSLTNTIFSASKTLTGGTWSSGVAISDPTVNSIYPQVTVDPSGNATAVWFTYNVSNTVDYSNVNVYSSTLSSGSWSTPVGLLSSVSGMRNPADLSLAIVSDSSGNVSALWSLCPDGTTFMTETAFKLIGGTWKNFAIIDASLYDLTSSLSINSRGDAFAAFMYFNNSSYTIQTSNSYLPSAVSNFWTVPIMLSTNIQNGYPQIATALVSNTAAAVCLWTSFDGSNTIIQASTGTGTIVLPPSNLSVVQSSNNQNVFTEYLNTLSWTASPSAKANNYVIYRDGVKIAQLPATQLSYVDHNRHQNETVTYGIATLDEQNSQSATVTVSFPSPQPTGIVGRVKAFFKR